MVAFLLLFLLFFFLFGTRSDTSTAIKLMIRSGIPMPTATSTVLTFAASDVILELSPDRFAIL